MTESCASTFNG